MTFQARVDAETLTSALEPVRALVDECTLHLNEDGITTQAVDPANVAMVSLDIDRSAFDHYQAQGGSIGVNLRKLLDVLGFADTDSTVSLALDPETRTLDIEIDGLEYTLALIDPDSIRQEPDMPELDWPATYVFEGREFDRAVRAADLCSDHILVEGVSDSLLAIMAEGDTDDVTVDINGEKLLNGRHDAGERDDVRSLFSLDYLRDISQPIDSDTALSLLVGVDIPLRLKYSFADGDVSVVNVLAPRVQS